MKKYLLFSLMLSGNFALAQLNEAFNDENFTSSPIWNSRNAGNDFTIVANQLRSNSLATNSNFYISTANALATNCQWEFWANLQFNTSGPNYVDVYLTSDQSDLQSANISGYFIRMGNSSDEISLYKRSGATSVKLIDGADGILNTSNNKVKIRVTRTGTNVFTLERDLTGSGNSYISEGSIQDGTFTTSSYFGIFVQQSTSGFVQKHFFDDFKISPLFTDTSAPEILSSTVLDSSTLQLNFNEPLDSIAAKITSNYFLDKGYNHPLEVRTTSDASKYQLKWPSGFSSGSYLLTLANIKDREGNTIAPNTTTAFSYTKPFVAREHDLVINEIFADPSPQVDLPSVEFIEIYNANSQTIKLANWKYADPSSTASFPADSIRSGEYLILCAKADTNEFKVFGKTIGISPWPTLNNASDIIRLISPENKTIDSVSYADTWHPTTEKKQGGWSLERVNYKSRCSGLFNWAASTNMQGGTPGKRNSVFVEDFDALAFKADSIKILSDTALMVYLNKPADISTQNNAFTLSPSTTSLKSIIFNAGAKQATLIYNSKFRSNTSYEFSIIQLKDCAGNTINSNPFEFATAKDLPLRTDTAKIFITEIFADPSPEVKLPLSEFIEIYNEGKDTINLEGWTLNDPAAKAGISKQTILPDEYIILCPAADTALYKFYGKTIGLSPWPSLNNASDQISLKSFTGRVVDSISFSDTWHTNATKKQGGWSLERIDYSSACSTFYNWLSSVDTSGGTPGKKNSTAVLDYDKLGFKADSINRLSDSTLVVYFNKATDGLSVTNSFTLSPASATLKSYQFDSHFREVRLIFDKSFLPGTSYQLKVSGINDCVGNEIESYSSLNFSTPQPPAIRVDTASLYIMEIFADPSPEVKLPLAEFVEIYNPGDDVIDLRGWTLSSSGSKAVFKETVIFPKEYLIVCPVSDTIQYKPFGRTVGISPWPALNNTAGQLSLKSFKNRLVDSISYSDSWHSTSAKKQGGWSLERTDYRSVCGGLFNWASATDFSGGTPGKPNSVMISNYDQITFLADSTRQLNDTSIAIYFNKHADVSTAVSGFSLHPAANFKSVVFDQQAKKAVIILKDKLTTNTSYQLTIAHLKDCSGNSLSSSHLTFTTPKAPPVRADTAKIYITEIFADPSPEIKLPLEEFVEIFNAGMDTVKLDGYTLSNSKTKGSIKNGLILPNEYLILCRLADTAEYQAFGKVAGITSWPALTNGSDQVVLKSFQGRTVDSILYSENWHTSSVKKQGGWSLERTDYQSLCGGTFNWASSVHPGCGTPGSKNSVQINNYDKLPFSSDNTKLISDTSVNVFFNKHTDIATAAGSFTLSPYIPIKSIIFDPQALKATLVFANKFAANTTYHLAISLLKDCSGNIISPHADISFTTAKAPEVFLPKADTAKLYITEIFADPSPEVKLPLAEFIEIFNPGRDTIDLSGWTLNDPVSTSLIKNSAILPQQYVILCPETDTLQYQPFGKTVGLPTWPSLNNTSDQITLKSFKGRLVDSISYNDTWYQNETKKTGGWSLEMIDQNAICTGIQNWIASIDSAGGTPGRKNSVYQVYKDDPLRITQVALINSTTVHVTFNRLPDSLTAVNPLNYALNNGAGNPLTVSLAGSQAELKFPNEISRGNTYRLSTRKITDCSGTEILSSDNYAEFFYPNSISKGNILITEILFNPREGGADFVEIYNNSDKTIDLKDLYIATVKAPDSIISKKNLSASTLLFPPNKYLALSIDPENIKKEYHVENPSAFVQMLSMPAFNNDQGAVVLLTDESRIDQFNYSEKMHFALIKDPKGISLERSSFSSPANNPGNFRSAASSVGYATPGYRNSQSTANLFNDAEEVGLLSKTFSPDNDGFEDALQISYHFNEPGMVANASIYNEKGTLIRRLTKNSTLAAEGILTWDGLTEDTQKAPVGIYIVYFDVFSLKGISKKYRKACVLAARLN